MTDCLGNYKKLLSCWHKMEHFSPASLPKLAKGISPEGKIPWENSSKPTDENKTIEYTVYLGVFNSSKVNDFVEKYFKDKNKDDKNKDENYKGANICFASLKLDNKGKYINESFGISTLPWALRQLKKNKIKKNNWAEDFDKLKENLLDYLKDEFSETIFDFDNLKKLEDKIKECCGWSDIWKNEKETKIYFKKNEIYTKSDDKEKKSNADILNSFYIKDLEKLLSLDYSEVDNIPKAFKEYMNGCLCKKTDRIDVVEKVNELKSNLTPDNYPDGCWPSEYTLSLMQQYAVNIIFNKLSEKDSAGMFSVNGPPGTGKTTLLRDIIAPILVKRAKELIKIDKPYDAFEKVGSLKINDNFSQDLYAPKDSIPNSGILVASSNNGAVENISKELPLKQEISEEYKSHIEYFKAVAEDFISKDNWGIISAVLGNKQNRNSLVNKLWFDRKVKGLQETLKNDKIYDNSKWEAVRDSFNEKLSEIADEKKRLNQIKTDYEDFVKTQGKLQELYPKVEKTKTDFNTKNNEYVTQKAKNLELSNSKEAILKELSIIKSSKPSFFTYLFNKGERNTYKKALENALSRYNNINETIIRETTVLSKIEQDFNSLIKLLDEQEKEITDLETKIEELTIKTDEAKAELKNNYADNEFWEKIESKESQESCPWYSKTLKKLQSELFIISLKLNEIFILTANAKSSRISTTLTGFFEYLKGEKTPPKEQIKAMWNTFFIVFPIVSSTFASIQTMLKDLDKEDIPWLFIDEAGQAIPQAAVGSIWRSKRVVVVGDPFQIEPVVTIPSAITDKFSEYFDLSSSQVSSELSVQSMADRINPLGTYIDGKWIGIPLRVHRRCIDPMFTISNQKAYNETMYCSTTNPKNVKVDFQTSFIHCTGNVGDHSHFVQEQAVIIKELLKKEINHSKGLPDIFVITPFSEISYLLKKFFYADLNKEDINLNPY